MFACVYCAKHAQDAESRCVQSNGGTKCTAHRMRHRNLLATSCAVVSVPSTLHNNYESGPALYIGRFPKALIVLASLVTGVKLETAFMSIIRACIARSEMFSAALHCITDRKRS